MKQKCPHCGASLPKEASFCPHCATSINARKEMRPPRQIPRKAVLTVAVGVVAFLTMLVLFCQLKPHVYVGEGEVFYTDGDGRYQVVLAWADQRLEPVSEIRQTSEEGQDYRFPSRMYINHVETGADATAVFMKKVASSSIEVLQSDEEPGTFSCSEPASMDFAPDAALVTLVDFRGMGVQEKARLRWTLRMKNGDTIQVDQMVYVDPILTLEVYPEDRDMSTADALQTLIRELAETNEPDTVINLHLPPVTYREELSINGHSFNLIGSDDEAGHRTTFLKTVLVGNTRGFLPEFRYIDFVGDGTGVGVSCSGRLHLLDCRFRNCKTGVLAYGGAWVNVMHSEFSENEVGFYFNSDGESVTHTQYTGNHFCHNGTAVLLERVPTDVGISFAECVFKKNEVDIDNRCKQKIDISEATFK